MITFSDILPDRPSSSPKPPQASGKKKKLVSHGDEEDLTAAMSSMALPEQSETADAASSESDLPVHDPPLEILLEEPATLLIWDRLERAYAEEGAVVAKIAKLKDEPFRYFITAWNAESGQMLAHRISSNLMARWAAPMWALTWNHVSQAGDQNSWGLHFQSQDGFDRFQEEFTKKLWETLNETSWEKIKVRHTRVYIFHM